MNYVLPTLDVVVLVCMLSVAFVGVRAVVDEFRDQIPGKYRSLAVLLVILYLIGRLGFVLVEQLL